MSWFRKKTPTGPDFSAVDTREKALALAERGELIELLLLPEEFGGQAVLPNIVHVPAFVVDLKRSTDMNVIMPLAREGKITRYSAEPSYAGSSFVPVAIRIVAHDPGQFTSTIRIWGEGLADD